MGSLLSIMTVIGPLLTQLTGIAAAAIQASMTNDQATLDRLHAQALALADSLKPAGA